MHVIAGLEIRVLSALRGLFVDARWTNFVCFFRHRARLLRRHPGRAACSRARAAGVVAEVCQTVKMSASPQNMKCSYPKTARQIIFSADQCFENR